MLHSETKQQTKLNERLLTSSVFRENLPFFQGCSKKQITCVSQIAQLCAAVHTTVWYVYLLSGDVSCSVHTLAHLIVKTIKKSKRRKVINKENKQNDNDDDDDDDDDDDKNKMVESPPELFLQLAEQAEICRTSCDLLKSCPDRKGKFKQHIISARG